MKKLLHAIGEFIRSLLRFFNKSPKSWIISDLGPTLPSPPSHPQEEPLFAKEEDMPGPPRSRDKYYRYYSELSVFLAEGLIDKRFPVGSTFYIPRQAYVNHHLEQRPNTNPRSYYNGPNARELNNRPFFTMRGVTFRQELIYARDNGHGYTAGEALFKIERTS